MANFKSVKNLTFISVIKFDEYGAPVPQDISLHYVAEPVFEEDYFGIPIKLIRWDVVSREKKQKTVILKDTSDCPF